MTAPAVAQPTGTPATPADGTAGNTTAPSLEITQDGRWGAQDAIASITADAVAKTLAEQAPTDAIRARDEQGRFAKAEQATTDAALTTAAVDAATGETAQPASDPNANDAPVLDLPEGFAAVKAIEGRELATPFTVKDQDGELEIPDVMIEFVANGKPRAEPLDKVVKLAQMGVFNQERHEQTVQVQRENDALRQQVAQIQQLAQQWEQERQALLSSDDAYLRARAQYEAENTPEYRAQLARQELEQTQQQIAFSQAAQAGQQFLATTLEPAVQQIAKALPTVSEEEIGARLLLVSDRYRVHTPFGSIIPPHAYDAVKQVIVQDIAPWAMQLHDLRSTERTAATRFAEQQTANARAEAERARIEAQKARNLGTRPASPGRRGTPTGAQASDPQAPKPIKTVDDAVDFSVRDAVAKAMAGVA